MENSFQRRFEEIIRIANILYPTLRKSTMEVIKCNGRNSKIEFDLRTLNTKLLYKQKKNDI